MKKIILLFMLFIVVANVVFAAVNTQYFGKIPNILVSLTKQEPDPVEPAQLVEVSFKLENNGTTAYDVEFEILPEYPFSLVPGESPTKFIGTIGTSQDGKQSVIVKYKLKVAEDAVDDNHKIKVRYKSSNVGSWITLEDFRIKVQTHDAILAVEKFFTAPAVTAPGDKTKLRLELKNYATSLLKDIKISLNLDKSDETKSFSPVGSTNEKVISYIEPQATIPIEYELLVDSDAASKAYKVPLDVKYSDVLNKNYSKTSLVTIVVGDNPDLAVTLDKTEVYTSESAGSIVIRLVNKGVVDIKFANIKLLLSNDYRILSNDEVYLGNIDSDDFETAEFKLFVEKTNKKQLELPLVLEYKDSNNNDYNDNLTLKMNIYSSSEAKKLGLKEGNGLKVFIVVAIVIIVGIFYYRRYWKHRRKA